MSKEGFFWKKDCKLQWLPRTIYRFFLKRFLNINSVKKGVEVESGLLFPFVERLSCIFRIYNNILSYYYVMPILMEELMIMTISMLVVLMLPIGCSQYIAHVAMNVVANHQIGVNLLLL